MDKTFGELVRETRKRKGLSMRELARRCDMSNAYLSQLETGKAKKPSSEVVKKISDELDIPFAILYVLADVDPELKDHLPNGFKNILKMIEHTDDYRGLLTFNSGEEFLKWSETNTGFDFLRNFDVEKIDFTIKKFKEILSTEERLVELAQQERDLKQLKELDYVELSYALSEEVHTSLDGEPLTQDEKDKILRVARALRDDMDWKDRLRETQGSRGKKGEKPNGQD